MRKLHDCPNLLISASPKAQEWCLKAASTLPCLAIITKISQLLHIERGLLTIFLFFVIAFQELLEMKRGLLYHLRLEPYRKMAPPQFTQDIFLH